MADLSLLQQAPSSSKATIDLVSIAKTASPEIGDVNRNFRFRITVEASSTAPNQQPAENVTMVDVLPNFFIVVGVTEQPDELGEWGPVTFIKMLYVILAIISCPTAVC